MIELDAHERELARKALKSARQRLIDHFAADDGFGAHTAGAKARQAAITTLRNSVDDSRDVRYEVTHIAMQAANAKRHGIMRSERICAHLIEHY